VVQIDGQEVTLNLLDHHRGQVAGHGHGISQVTDVGGLLAIDAGHRLIVLRVTGLRFAEPGEVHRRDRSRSTGASEPLRNIKGIVVGWLENRRFQSDALITPPLGAECFPLQHSEFDHVLGGKDQDGPITLGTEYRNGNSVKAGLNTLLAQHVAVLGGSGQGKSCFTAAILQQLAAMPRSRIVIFDINNEYDRAFKISEEDLGACRLEDGAYQYTTIGEPEGGEDHLKIPYYALGRQGMHRLLLPSEKTQRPALSFAVDHLRNVEWVTGQEGARLAGEAAPVFFDDCRQKGAGPAMVALDELRSGSSAVATEWPHMSAIGALVAESQCLQNDRQGRPERSAWNYGNVSPVITRIRRLVEDDMFQSIVDVQGGAPASGTRGLHWQRESEHLVDQIFGNTQSNWRIHVVNLRQIPQDLMPLILGSLLELYAHVLFKRGQGNSPATMLVLEEAHHYLRPITEGGDSQTNALAYERLAKEGRKFGLSLWLSTQRPSEVSPTVLSQCSTWVSFRLNSEQDLRVIQNACEWADSRDVRRIAGLPRQHALVLGGSVTMPTCIKAPYADPTPDSHDGAFDSWQNI
jgi:hypothetical protein